MEKQLSQELLNIFKSNLSLKNLNLHESTTEKNDEILVPSFIFVATANVIKYCNAIPHFIDIEEKNFGINILKLKNYLKKNTIIKNNLCINKRTGRIIRGIIPVHIFGHPIEIDKLISLAKKFNLFVIEDSAESLGNIYKKKHTGTFEDIRVLSFNGNKIITTGADGAIITNKRRIINIPSSSFLTKFFK